MWILLPMIAIMPFEMNPYLLMSRNFMGVLPDFTVIKLLGFSGVSWAGMRALAGKVRIRLWQSPQVKAFAVFLFFVTMAGLAGGAGLRPVTRLLAIVFLIPLVMVAVRRGEGDLRLALLTATVAMIVIFPYGYRNMRRFNGRYGVGLYEPNYVALGLVLLLPLAFAFWRQARGGLRRTAWLGGLGVLLLSLMLTGSRGGMVGLLVVVPLICFRLVRHPLPALAGAVALFGLLMTVPSPLQRRVVASLDPDVTDNAVEGSNQTRLQVFKAGVRMVQESPLIGIGLGNFKPATLEFGADKDKIAHSTFLELAAELGVPALLAFLAVLYTSFASLRRSERFLRKAESERLRQLSVAMQIALAGYAVTAMFLSAQYEKSIWLMIALSISLERIARAAWRARADERAKEAEAWTPA